MDSMEKDFRRGMRVAAPRWLRTLKKLRAGWDGPGSQRGDEVALEAAAAMAALAEQAARRMRCVWKEPLAALHPDGSVELVWQTKALTDLNFWFPLGWRERAWLRVYRRGNRTAQRELTLAEGAREVLLILDLCPPPPQPP